MQSAFDRFSRKLAALMVIDGDTILFTPKSSAIERALDRKPHVSSFDQQSDGALHGMFTMKASTISTDRERFASTCPRTLSLCVNNLFDSADASGRKRAAAASIDVNRYADRPRTYSAVCSTGSRPHLE